MSSLAHAKILLAYGILIRSSSMAGVLSHSLVTRRLTHLLPDFSHFSSFHTVLAKYTLMLVLTLLPTLDRIHIERERGENKL
jgi:hypothetical protein